MDTQYIGEHLLPGQLGHFFVITSFVAALFSSFAYFRSAQTEHDANNSKIWLLLGRNAFVIHAAMVAGIFITLFYLITNHYFEYHYVWDHSDLSLSPKYLLSCFWEGQQGSFLLWSIWHCVLGMVVMATAKGLESRTMSIIALVQVLLATMLLGFHFSPDFNIGTSPFILLRDKMQGAPIFEMPNYLERIQDGQGLNILLQNYWMVIHPPVLFLGFASTLIPFAYTIAALWKGEYNSWVRETRIWSLFSGAVLGTGIMMGGAWAYESLTFGGYWAWDPVENASLVPWLTLIAGLHTLIIYKATGRSFILTTILFGATYLLIWYSTFLTRTGVLGETSVHAFTGEGQSLYWHLLIVIGILLAITIGLLIKRWKGLPRVKTEEQLSSREFWMFVGSIILFLSALHIILATSMPVWSPLYETFTGKKPANFLDPVQYYNSVQVWVAIIIAILSGATLYLKFKKSDSKKAWKKLGLTGAIGLVIALLIGFAQKIDAPQYALLLFATSFSLVANLYYAIAIQKSKIKKLGAAITHFGFALSLLGILLSSYNKEVISLNTLGVVFNFGGTQAENLEESRENVLLYKEIPVVMGDYTVTYQGDSIPENDPRTFFKVNYVKRNEEGKVVEEFMLYPNAFVNAKGMEEGSLSANPASKHYLSKDIFTYVNSYLASDAIGADKDYKSHIMKKGDTVYLNNGYMVFGGFDRRVNNPNYVEENGDIAVEGILNVYNLEGQVDTLSPVFILRNQKFITHVADTMESMKLHTYIAKVIPEQEAAEVMVNEDKAAKEYIVLKALMFPYINVLWVGIIVMVLGFLLGMWNRITKKEKVKK